MIRVRLKQGDFGRRTAACLVLVAYCVTSVGIPISSRSIKKGDVPFPCQNHACGCQSALECWTHCCCFSVEERWAWARENGVEPPEYAVKPTPHNSPAPDSDAHREVAASSACSEGYSKKSCCVTNETCCQHDIEDRAIASSHEHNTKPAGVLGLSPDGCKGKSGMTAGTVLGISQLPSCQFQGLDPAVDQILALGPRAFLQFERPPIPPPRSILRD